MIPLCEPRMTGKEWDYIKDCLETNWVSSVGQYVDKFEGQMADYVQKKYAVACVNGTAALHTALLVAGIQPQEEVLVSGLTFVAPVNAIRYVGAYPVFIDVQPDTWQMDPQKVKNFLSNQCELKEGCLVNKTTKRRVRAILPVDILGHSVDMDPVLDVARQYGLFVIEDAAESLGALYKESKVGSKADISCFSFNGNKIITTGGGGMLVTDNRDWAERCRYLTTQAKDDPLESIHEEIGYNYRLTNIQAAMGVAQMAELDEYVKIKRSNAKKYDEGLSDIEGLSLPQEASWAKATFWLYTVLIDENVFGMSSREVLKDLKKEGILTRPFWHPAYRLKPFQSCYADQQEIVDKLYARGLSLPSSVGLKEEEQRRVIQKLKDCQKS